MLEEHTYYVQNKMLPVLAHQHLGVPGDHSHNYVF